MDCPTCEREWRYAEEIRAENAKLRIALKQAIKFCCEYDEFNDSEYGVSNTPVKRWLKIQRRK